MNNNNSSNNIRNIKETIELDSKSSQSESTSTFSYLISVPMRFYQNTSSFVRQVAWPTSLADGRRSELALLRHGGIPNIPSRNCLIYNVKIQDSHPGSEDKVENGVFSSIYKKLSSFSMQKSCKREPDCFIHTCAIDTSDSGLSDLKFVKSNLDDPVKDPLAHENDESLTLIDSETVSFAPSPHKSPIVICHGFGAGLAFFFKNLWPISSSTGRRVYAMDWIGMGRSSRPSFSNYLSGKVEDPKAKAKMTEEAIDFFVESLEDWRGKHSDTKKIILVGHSLGGYLATWYALKYPERIEKLILVSPVGIPIPEPSHSSMQQEENDRDKGGESFTTQSGHKVSHTAFTRFLSSLWDRHYTPQWLIRTAGPFGPKLVRSYTMRRFHYLTSEESLHLRDYLYHISAFEKGSAEFAAMGTILAPFAFARKPLLPFLSKLKVPTDFMYGDVDWMDHRHAIKAQEDMNSAGNGDTRVHVVTGAGHHLYLDNPNEFNNLLADIINNK